MKTNKISEYVASVSAESRADMAADRWDEVMTDALYAAVNATTPEEMQEARRVASEIARRSLASACNQNCDWCEKKAVWHDTSTRQCGCACHDHRRELVKTLAVELNQKGNPFAGEAAEAFVRPC